MLLIYSSCATEMIYWSILQSFSSRFFLITCSGSIRIIIRLVIQRNINECIVTGFFHWNYLKFIITIEYKYHPRCVIFYCTSIWFTWMDPWVWMLKMFLVYIFFTCPIEELEEFKPQMQVFIYNKVFICLFHSSHPLLYVIGIFLNIILAKITL